MSNLLTKIEQGREAIALAKEKGLDVSAWQRELIRLENLASGWREQLKEAPPSRCKDCGKLIYWQQVSKDKKIPVEAWNFERHFCAKKLARRDVDRAPRNVTPAMSALSIEEMKALIADYYQSRGYVLNTKSRPARWELPGEETTNENRD